MLQSAFVRFTIRIIVLLIAFVLTMAGLVLGSAAEFDGATLPPAMPVAIAAGAGAAVVRRGQLASVPVDVALARETSGCPDAVHCLAISADTARIRQRQPLGYAWWTQQLDGDRITGASVYRVDALMALPALLIAAALSQGVAWWLRRRVRRNVPSTRRRETT